MSGLVWSDLTFVRGESPTRLDTLGFKPLFVLSFCCRYIRLKRHNTTVFMHCEPADNFASVKAKAGKLMGIDAGQIGLFATRDKVYLARALLSILHLAIACTSISLSKATARGVLLWHLR